MPVSQKPRRKKTELQLPKRTSPAPALPDPRGMEGFMSKIVGGRPKDAVTAAQEIMYDAWDQWSPPARVALARKALAVSPLCADAYLLLAEEEAKSVEEALACFRKGVEAGEQALGPARFEEYAGHFWGFLETRPYMRARAGLAATLNALGEVDAAIGHYSDMLRLNPNDNQGIRYVLAACLMKRGDTEALKKLFNKYDEDESALWLYSRALVAFRESEGSEVKAREFARNALRANGHVPAVLTGGKKVRSPASGYLTVGGEDEAAHYVEEWGFDWLATPGAIDWLTKIAGESTPTRTKRPSVH